ncbi:hypothetical protein [Adhaeretor mobilis]|uniref:Uncharacterized protein n=1 Tax=Adhaeretor mobilis TaxID=1930276 RepID=A0A517MRV7_9BACT|nr:hypothetical protein [Adhaeretor mobilis]QDS97615.1 hypothetical protein HG15A2_08780 [Adhaeretor mobilis]
MQALEFSQGFIRKRFGIAFVLTPESADALLEDFRSVKETLLQWSSSRGKKSERVMFTVMAEPDQFDEYEALFRQLVEEEHDLAPIFSKLQVQLEFPDRRGKSTERSVTLNAPSPTAAVDRLRPRLIMLLSVWSLHSAGGRQLSRFTLGRMSLFRIARVFSPLFAALIPCAYATASYGAYAWIAKTWPHDDPRMLMPGSGFLALYAGVALGVYLLAYRKRLEIGERRVMIGFSIAGLALLPAVFASLMFDW